MNYRYIPDCDDALRAIVSNNPTASLDEIHQAHPSLRAMSLDHLSLRLARLTENRRLVSAR